ncbi:MAG: 16S rRNA (cytidine(1402)-2'-O)-methyltransferase [Neisseriaceae bacterium]|nr:16S rRNA (cytidine(1402)-2'-O)-methyltransferase [Neisseriaceae bacterium]
MLCNTYFNKVSTTFNRGALYVLATPIGNLSDISLRALALLENADVICAEDTRVTNKLLSAYGLRKNLISVREHNEREMAEKIIERLRNNEIVVQVSDAGTPAICDPGARIVHAVRQANLPVYPIPGACALITALSGAGIIGDDFYFAGFLPAKSSQRQKTLQNLYRLPCTIITYETPHRIMDTLSEMANCNNQRTITLIRELTKTFETYLSGRPNQLIEQLIADEYQRKGEMVLIIHPDTLLESLPETNIDIDNILDILSEELPTKQAAQLAAQISGLNKKELYERILKLKQKS